MSSNPMERLSELSPDDLRGALPELLARRMTEPEVAERISKRCRQLVAQWQDRTCQQVMRHLAKLGEHRELYPAHPACREMSRQCLRDVITSWDVEGSEMLDRIMDGEPVALLANHLSYIDATAIDALLSWAGYEALADRLVYLAGPKVYSDLFRRVAASCLNSLPVPQSTGFAHTARLKGKELLRQVRQSLESVEEERRQGYHLFFFPEGSRTRTGELQPFLRASWRYLDRPGLQVVPVAIVGTGRLMPVGETRVSSGSVRLRIGEPLVVGEAARPRKLVGLVHAAVARLLAEASKK